MGLTVGPILVVDDEKTVRDVLSTMLEIDGYPAETVRDGGAALVRLLAEPRPRLVLLDIMMPVVDGFTVLRWMNANPDTATIPVIIMSAKVDHLAVRAAANHGAAGFLTKPFDQDELHHLIETAINREPLATAQVAVPDLAASPTSRRAKR